MTTTRRRFLTGLGTLALAPAVLSACGRDSGGGDESRPDEDWETVEIDHRYGTTTIDRRPTKIAVVGLLEQDMLLALGVAPIATSFWFGEADGRIFSWAREAFDATGADLPTVLDVQSDGINTEEVIGLGPDLVIGIYSDMTEDQYTTLSGFCPTIAASEENGDYGTPWDEIQLTVGRALGMEAEAQEIVDSVNARYAEEAEANAELFEGTTVGVVTPFEGLFVYGGKDTRPRMLEALGIGFPEALANDEAEAAGKFGWSFSVERTTDLDQADAVVWLDFASADEGLTQLWESTNNFEEGRWIGIGEADGDYSVAHTMVTSLSIPFVLDTYVPQLVAALDGDPATEPPTSEA